MLILLLWLTMERSSPLQCCVHPACHLPGLDKASRRPTACRDGHLLEGLVSQVQGLLAAGQTLYLLPSGADAIRPPPPPSCPLGPSDDLSNSGKSTALSSVHGPLRVRKQPAFPPLCQAQGAGGPPPLLRTPPALGVRDVTVSWVLQVRLHLLVLVLFASRSRSAHGIRDWAQAPSLPVPTRSSAGGVSVFGGRQPFRESPENYEPSA